MNKATLYALFHINMVFVRPQIQPVVLILLLFIAISFVLINLLSVYHHYTNTLKVRVYVGFTHYHILSPSTHTLLN